MGGKILGFCQAKSLMGWAGSRRWRSPRSLQYCLATFRQVWNMARKNGLVSEESPTRAVKIPTIENKRTRFLSPEEAGELLAYLKPRNPTIHDMAFLSLFSGMRLGEIISLKWGAVDLDRGLVTIYDAKGGRPGRPS